MRISKCETLCDAIEERKTEEIWNTSNLDFFDFHLGGPHKCSFSLSWWPNSLFCLGFIDHLFVRRGDFTFFFIFMFGQSRKNKEIIVKNYQIRLYVVHLKSRFFRIKKFWKTNFFRVLIGFIKLKYSRKDLESYKIDFIC